MGTKRASEATAAAKSSKYINLEDDGARAIFTIPWMGEEDEFDPHVHEQIWNEKTERFEPFTAAHKAAGKEPNCRFFFTVYGKEKEELQVFQCTIGTYKEILVLKDKHGDLSKIFIEVRRHGAKGSKKTKYNAMYDSQVDEVLRAKIQKMERFNLQKEANGGSSGTSSGTNGDSKDSNGKMPAHVADALLNRLRALPEAKRDLFLKEFKITRVRDDLMASQVDAANKFVDQLEGQTKDGDAFG